MHMQVKTTVVLTVTENKAGACAGWTSKLLIASN